jgi:hypothetical protein
MNLIIVESGEISDAGEVSLAGARATHLMNVLRIARDLRSPRRSSPGRSRRL